MFNWLKSLFGKSTVDEYSECCSQHSLYSDNSNKVLRILVADGKISGRDVKEICGTAYKVKKCMKELRECGHNIICKPTALEKKGGKHTFNGTCVEYILAYGDMSK